MGVFLLFILGGIAAVFVDVGLVMLFIGNLHHDIHPIIPPLGWSSTFWLVLPLNVLALVGAGFKGAID